MNGKQTSIMTANDFLQGKIAAYYTLGCKLNFAETSTIGKILSEQGVRRAAEGEVADICVVNTCCVTELAEKKCRQAIRKIAKENPGAFVVVTGCYAQLGHENLSKIKEVDLILGTEQKLHIIDYLRDLTSCNGHSNSFTSPLKDIRSFLPSCSADDRTRHFLKVQDGCDYFCTYCTIPFARGRSRNGSIASMVDQARQVVADGGKEIVLTGVNIGDFGKSTGESFIDLIRSLDDVEGILRYRISSFEPDLISDEAIDFIAASKRFAPHFHIPLQCGSDEVLKLMHRRYDTALFRHKIEKIKEMIPDAFIGVDVIVGMRGETDALFEESRRFIDSLDVTQLHVFSYSERPGTMALKIPYVVSHDEKHRRSQALLQLSDSKLHAFYDRHIGRQAKVLFEHTKGSRIMHGFTENYIRTEIPYDERLVNEVRTVTLSGWNRAGDALTVKEMLP